MGRTAASKRERGNSRVGRWSRRTVGNGGPRSRSGPTGDSSKTVPDLSARKKWPSECADKVVDEDSDGSDDENWQDLDEERCVYEGTGASVGGNSAAISTEEIPKEYFNVNKKMDQNPAAYLLPPPVDKLRMKSQRARFSKERHRDGARAARGGKRKTEPELSEPQRKVAKGVATLSDGSVSFGSDRSSGVVPIWTNH